MAKAPSAIANIVHHMFIPIHLTSDVEAARHCRCEVTRDMAIALRNVRLLEFWCRLNLAGDDCVRRKAVHE
ncbi:MAG: hypothetical protein WAM03_22495, partial [Pseudolabrys sp.]